MSHPRDPGSTTKPLPGDFDATALFQALDARRMEEGLTWRQVADELWQRSAALNVRRRDHPISPSTLTNIPKRGDCTCQHALFILRWLELPPEAFQAAAPASLRSVPLPDPGAERRLRWDLHRLYADLDARRSAQRLTWAQLAVQLHCGVRRWLDTHFVVAAFEECPIWP